jgi:hypothetical protein
MKDSTSHDTKLGVVHAGPTAIDDLAELILETGQGRAFILAERGVPAAARAHVESVLTHAGMPFRVVECSPTARRNGGLERIAADLAGFAGAALISVGGSTLIEAGKTVATVATNPLRRAGQPLLARPRAHLAVPTELGPAEESTNLVRLAEHAEPLVDDRVTALSVIDDRLFPDTHPDTGRFKLLAVALAACTIADETATLRESTLALSAVHHLVDPQVRPVDVRQALALAAAGHPRWPLCPRCQAGTVLPTATLDQQSAHSPARMCLQQAVARGLTLTA